MTCADSSSELLLALNGADERLQLVLGRSTPEGPATLLAAQEWTVPGCAVRFLAPGVRQMLDGLGLAAPAIRRIACVTGPGSFTGLRMALAAAQGLAAATGAALAGLDHLELLAREAAQLAQGAVAALVWARRGQVYAQGFGGQNAGDATPGTTALGPVQVLALTALPDFLAALPRPLCLLGGGLRKNLAFFEDLAARDPGLRLLPSAWDAPRPEALLDLAAGAAFGPGPLAPAYLRASDAEANLADFAASRGLSVEEARRILGRGSQPV